MTAQPEPHAADGDYNRTYEELEARAPNTPVAAIAYLLYKSAKRQWVRDFQGLHGRRPGEAEHRSHALMQTDEVLHSYLSRAEQILSRFGDTVIARAEPDILRSALRGRNWVAFWISLAATFAFTALLAALVGIAAVLGFGLPISVSVGG